MRNLLPDRNSALVRWASHALFALALVFCAVAIARMGLADIVQQLQPGAWQITIGIGAAYGLLLALLAFAWTLMAGAGAGFTIRDRIAIYGPGVIAKYIPGSIFQYGSRQLLGGRFGLGQGEMVRASVVEAGLHVIAALTCAGVMLAGGGLLALGGIAVIGASLIALGSSPLARAAGYQLAFFAVFTGLVALLAQQALGTSGGFALAGMFMIAWVAGFLVPVAPGGIGVRESVLLALAASASEPTAATLAALALLSRFVTTLGDAAFGLAGYGLLVSRRSKTQASS
jgi:hypothetical protein